MARHRRIFVSFVGLVVLAILAASCSSDEPAEVQPAAPPEQVDAAPDAEEPTDEIEDAREFYRNNVVTLDVSSAAGGGHDTQARLLAPFLGEALGTNVIVRNITGGGGIEKLNLIYNAPNQDGTQLAILLGAGAAAQHLSGIDAVEFDLGAMPLLGDLDAAPRVVNTAVNGPYGTLEDLINGTNILFGAPGLGSTNYVDGVVLIEAFGIDGDVVTAFEGSGEYVAAMLAGDIAAYSRTLTSSLPGYEAGDEQFVFFLTTESPEGFEDVPNATSVADLYVSDAARQLMETHVAVLSFGRPILTHPEIPDARLQVLREAFDSVMADPEFHAAAEAINRPANFKNAAQTETVLEAILNAPAAYVELLQND